MSGATGNDDTAEPVVDLRSATFPGFDRCGRIRAINGNANAIKYDRAGNLTQGVANILGCMPNAPASTNALLTWDAWNRLVRVRTSVTGFDIRYAYDGLFRRTRQTVAAGNAASLDFYYNKDWKIVEERYVTGGTLRAQYIYGERGRNDIILRDAHLTPGATAQRHYATSDAMQSITGLTTAAGVVVQRYRYSAFGLPTRLTAAFVPATGTDALTGFTPLTSDTLQWQNLFHGETYDLDTSFANYGYRYYIPSLGRWPNRDPIEEEGGVNLYNYAGNNPIKNADKIGLEWGFPGESPWSTPADQRCGELIREAVKDPEVQAALELLKKYKCDIPSFACTCCNNPNWNGYYDRPGWFDSGSVVICTNRIFERDSVSGTVIHEFRHALQNCRGSDVNDCKSSICGEIEAYYNSPPCNTLPDVQRIDCAKNGTLRSAFVFCKKDGEDSLNDLGYYQRIMSKINEVFEQCKNKNA